MKAIWKLIVNGFKAIFCRDTISKVWSILFNGGKSTVGGILSNTSIMNAAFYYAKSLASSSSSSDDKRDAFNKVMREYLSSQGITIGTSILNVIRETALAAVNAEAEQCSECCAD